MSFVEDKQKIEEGDHVLAWMTRSDVRPIKVQSGELLNNRYGPFKHEDMVGRSFGAQQASSANQGFIHLLSPTPELWSLSLPHRTQIIYGPDASYIVHRLKIRPSSVVIEAGTGSGALTHALARTVSKSGKIFTFEYHESRCEQARAEFESHGLSEIVQITHRNVCEDGFAIDTDIKASAVFLDLPAPWTAIPHLFEHVDRSRAVHICCFSPCIEQVIKNIYALQAAGFQHIEMVENQARRWEGHQTMVRTVEESMDLLRDIRRRRQDGMDFRHGRVEKRKLDNYNPWGKGTRVREGDEGYNWRPVSWMETDIKSHTSYLTFAILPPTSPDKYK
ncbi:tRNA (adenine(58)-N(1))-methyltransferase catalytic subunit TRM61 [Wickerhamiella sorbophila]|uniref:tRNA (adenine(58)-N(1))-methyltransferase catalytic subunit TRM61 n=1 Tax=Wickerhamiella sorbophila TaxID=45607 RepID=A0A2T0FJM2_9ASCO|nr:tRNA (adenine(58)-N(1))-methyltransferase catalytic subunit TRM61 [Wickerhamiella sorbophila]PRT55194.1 tRNA (adenine(58)-N(1))-methyltransferase catalytic subunit TRM61 [Wickerhamiella sorbophila]